MGPLSKCLIILQTKTFTIRIRKWWLGGSRITNDCLTVYVKEKHYPKKSQPLLGLALLKVTVGLELNDHVSFFAFGLYIFVCIWQTLQRISTIDDSLKCSNVGELHEKSQIRLVLHKSRCG